MAMPMALDRRSCAVQGLLEFWRSRRLLVWELVALLELRAIWRRCALLPPLET